MYVVGQRLIGMSYVGSGKGGTCWGCYPGDPNHSPLTGNLSPGDVYNTLEMQYKASYIPSLNNY